MTAATSVSLPNLEAPLYGVIEVAALLHRSPHTVRLDASRAPSRLPPICRLPGHNRLLWRREDVMEWIAAAVVTSAAAPPLRRHRGRPPKAGSRARVAGART